MISPSAEEVDRAVKAALAAQRPVDRTEPHSVWTFAGRLLSARVLESIPSTVVELSIGPETVLTPMARDQIKRRKICLKWLGRVEARQQNGLGEWGFSVDSKSWSMTMLRRMLLMTDDWLDLGDDPQAAALWVAEGQGRGAALLTDQQALAVWQANATNGVRAAAISDADGITRAVSSLGPNLLVIDPLGKSVHELKHLAETFRKTGAPVLPDWLAGGNSHAHCRGGGTHHTFENASRTQEPPVRNRLTDASGRLDRGLAHAR